MCGPCEVYGCAVDGDADADEEDSTTTWAAYGGLAIGRPMVRPRSIA